MTINSNQLTIESVEFWERERRSERAERGLSLFCMVSSLMLTGIGVETVLSGGSGGAAAIAAGVGLSAVFGSQAVTEHRQLKDVDERLVELKSGVL